MSEPSLDTLVNDQKFISDNSEWTTFYNSYSSDGAKDIQTQMKQVITDGKSANEALAGNSLGIAQIEIPLTEGNITTFEEHRDILEKFSLNIHSDVLELVDDPFGEAVGDVSSTLSGIAKKHVTEDGTGLASQMQGIISNSEDRDKYAGIIESLDNAEINAMDTYLVEMDEETGEVTGGVIGLRGLEEYNLGDLFRLAKDGAQIHADKTSWEIIRDGYSFVVTRKNGKINIALKDISWNGKHGPTGRVDARNLLKDVFGIEGNKIDAHALINKGVDSRKFGDNLKKYDKLDDYVNGFNDAGRSTSTFVKSAVKKGLKQGAIDGIPLYGSIKDFRGGGKITGALGIAGDAFMIYDDLKTNLYNPETGKVEVTAAHVQRAATDIVVDAGISMGTTAICTAVGSAIVPPLGTVIGFGVGLGIDYLMNNVMVDADGDGVKKNATDGAKDFVDNAFDFVFGTGD